MTEHQKILHLVRRAGFGPSVKSGLKGTLDEQLNLVFESNKFYEELYLQDEERVTTR